MGLPEGWTIGKWQMYDEGEIHQILKKAITLLLDEKYEISVLLGNEIQKLEYGRRLFEILHDYEKSRGTSDIVDILGRGLEIKCSKENEENNIVIKTQMRLPSDSYEHMDLFKDMVVAWVEQNTLCFVERFFRLPKITEDIADRYLDNPLEKSLQRTFGFHFKYKIKVQCEKSSPKLEILRKKIYQVLR